ncbi:MAG: hypothetical protein GF364_22755 [Candidatus Lokiarchaeota archaeon]|nr:hypothetical protein [Candidatus Lokiarchaeota archaeon]
MQRITRLWLAALLLALVVITPVNADGPTNYYLPLVGGGKRMSVGDWDILVPEATTNLITNPSAEENVTDGWSFNQGGSGGSAAKDTTYAYAGAASAKIIADDTSVARLYSDNISLANGESLTVQARAYRTASGDDRVRIYDATNATYRVTDTCAETGAWEVMETTWTNDTGGSVNVQIHLENRQANSIHAVWFDAVQAEKKSYATTYCDGDQPGCEWNGEEHNSTSTRSAASRAGGRWYNLEDDYGVIVEGYLGTGMAPRSTSVDGYSQLPGGTLNNSVRTSRTFTLVGFINSTSYADLLDKRNTLIDVLSPEAYPRDSGGWQPVHVRHTGGTTTKWTAAHYEAGLEIDHNWRLPINERVALRFFAPDPNWYEIGESAKALDTNDTDTFRYIAGRLKSTGQWDDLDLSANPSTNGDVYAICVASDGTVYFGGDFTGWDGNSPSGGDYIIAYDPSAGSYSVLVGASDLNGIVYTIEEGPDKKIYIGGSFTQVNGDAGGDADYIIVYDPSSDAWEKLGTPNTGAASITSVRALAWDSSNNLYVGGNYTRFADVANADYIAKWDGSSWSAMDTGLTGYVATIAVDYRDYVYVGGYFSSASWRVWNGSSWSNVGGLSLYQNGFGIEELIFDDWGDLYVGSSLLAADSNNDANYVFKWTGTAVQSMDQGTNNYVDALELAPDARLYIAGRFTIAGDVEVTDYIARWNGFAWTPVDMSPPGTPDVHVFRAGRADPVIESNYDLYAGFSTTGSAQYGGTVTVTNSGNSSVHPKIVVARSGGTSATLISIRNHTTGKELYFEYDLVDGEELTIDLRLDRQTITSDFFGTRYNAFLPGSALGDFTLQPGDNEIVAYVKTAGAPAVTAYMLWRDAYDGIDD